MGRISLSGWKRGTIPTGLPLFNRRNQRLAPSASYPPGAAPLRRCRTRTQSQPLDVVAREKRFVAVAGWTIRTPMALFTVKDLLAAMPPQGRVIGIDPGSKTIGLALSDVRRRLASPYGSLKRG